MSETITGTLDPEFAIPPGSLYPMLRRMAKDGWLKTRLRGADRVYIIDAPGQKVLERLRDSQERESAFLRGVLGC